MGSEMCIRDRAQSDDSGVFGFDRADWDTSFSLIEERTSDLGSDGLLVYEIDDSRNLFVLLGNEGFTTYVEYEVFGSLSFNETEAFIVDDLLPGDAVLSGQYRNVLLGGSDPITVQLYVSDTVVEVVSGSSGIILVAYKGDVESFSVSVE